ncbi:Iron(3+)-hydroxamate import system permease protein FhuB [Striga asiatica]|uniref:Iron(3+)-hydroxamate import system permease protein FhuB n=1 Tax=Striga asiatica TaxID=4170 RepID=A0A5A7PCV1_STRAF|nr:Iron(3+)-hydroxamate import system permease protein FhuB [Striga asiatica]
MKNMLDAVKRSKVDSTLFSTTDGKSFETSFESATWRSVLGGPGDTFWNKIIGKRVLADAPGWSVGTKALLFPSMPIRSSKSGTGAGEGAVAGCTVFELAGDDVAPALAGYSSSSVFWTVFTRVTKASGGLWYTDDNVAMLARSSSRRDASS